MTIIHPCPACKNQHALIWYQGARSKILGVFCDASGNTRFIKLTDEQLQVVDMTKLAGIPIYYTPTATKKAALIGQYQLSMMHIKNGQQAERNVDTGRNNNQIIAELKLEIDQQAERNVDTGRNNNQIIAELKLEIDQHLQATKELDSQIEKLDIKRRTLKDEAKKLGVKLSEYQTEGLFKD